MKINNFTSQFEFVIVFLFLNFGRIGSAARLSLSANTEVDGHKTGQPGKASNEKNNETIKDDFLGLVVREYEIELEKELKRRESETKKNVQKVKREDSEVEVEVPEDSLTQYKLYRIVRAKRTPEREPSVFPDTPEDLMTQLQNNSKNFIQRLKKSLAVVGVDIKGKLEALQNNIRNVFSSDPKEEGSYTKMNNGNAEPTSNYVGNANDLLNAAFSGNKNVTLIDIKYSNANEKPSSRSMKLDTHGIDTTTDNDSLNYKENKRKEDKEDSSKSDRDKSDSTKADSVKEDSYNSDNAKADCGESNCDKSDSTKAERLTIHAKDNDDSKSVIKDTSS